MILSRLESKLRELDKTISATRKKIDENAVTEGNLTARKDILQRMRELSVEASSETLSDEDRSLIDTEFKALLEEYLTLLKEDTGYEALVVDSGENAGSIVLKSGDRAYFEGKWLSMSELNKGLTDAESSGKLISVMDHYLAQTTGQLSALGAETSKLTRRLNALLTAEEHAEGARSLLEDTDIAEEAMALVKEQLLLETSTLLTAHAMVQPERVLSLIKD